MIKVIGVNMSIMLKKLGRSKLIVDHAAITLHVIEGSESLSDTAALHDCRCAYFCQLREHCQLMLLSGF
ncbi:hypothetical protein GOP47_0008803 [Adiantum capillus-veneris]|uniref:Uncharacterized protein n=1 Tax=Adiantum capillus-veneris TaxID=13818 RepID=A0A9D4UZ95_ADICA|nr:hypothetical protein GOP47_0008803 [Adiantum capillus-veneris]